MVLRLTEGSQVDGDTELGRVVGDDPVGSGGTRRSGTSSELSAGSSATTIHLKACISGRNDSSESYISDKCFRTYVNGCR